MPVKDDGDIVRGLGFVTLYAAYMEEAVDACVNVFLGKDTDPPANIERWQISRRVGYVKTQLSQHATLPEELQKLPGLLGHVDELLERRNEVIHGRIYGGMQGEKDELRPGRPTGVLKSIGSADLYDLANTLFAALSPLNHAAWFALPRLFNNKA